MDNFPTSIPLYKALLLLEREGGWEWYTCCTNNAQDKTSTGHNGTELRPEMNNGDAYNKGVIQKCLHILVKEVMMSMMFTKTVSLFIMTQTFITS